MTAVAQAMEFHPESAMLKEGKYLTFTLDKEPPALATELSTSCILGMAKTEGSLKTLLDIDKVLQAQGIPVLSSAQ